MTTLHIHYYGDLYEIRYQGTLIYSIQKWYDGGRMVRTVGFLNLPKELQNNIVKQMKKKTI